MDVKWAKIASWHAIQHESDAGHSAYCGLVAQGEVVDDLPGTDKGCESCLKILVRLQEAEGAL